MLSLPVSRLIQVSVALAPAAAAGRNFSNALIIDDSNVISGLQRTMDVSSAPQVAQAFGATAAVTLAAQIYFGQSPAPASATIGRWLRTATAGMLQGYILSAAQSALTLFNQVTSGGFSVTVDGVVKALTTLNFSTALNLNGVATAITTAFAGSATCVWNGTQFVISSATTGAGVLASGTMTLTGQPSNLDTVTVNGIVITFVTGTPVGNQVLIGTTSALTAVNLNTFLTNSASANLLLMTYAVSGLVVTATAVSVGVAGNSLTLVKSCANMTLSAATLLGGLNPSSVSYATSPGSGQDVSSLLGFTAALALPLVPGYNAETALQAIVALDAISTSWYGVAFGSSVMPSTNDYLAIAPFIDADPVTRMFAITIQDSGAMASTDTTDLGSQLMALGYMQTFYQFCSSNPYAALSMLGRLFTVNFNAQNTMLDLMYKQQPGIVAEVLTTQEANTLQAKRYNVYAAYDNNTNVTQYATMAGPAYIDEIYGLDALQNALQTAEFNVLYQSTTKVPQTDQGTNQFVNAASGVCGQYVNNGFGAPGVWTGPSFGQIVTGQFLKTGFYVFAPSVATQSSSDRAARKSPPIQIAFKFAGSTQIVDVALTASR
jgi:uncharacterized protein DUF3383